MSLSAKTIKALRQLAADLGIRNRSKMRKDQLLAAIEAAQGVQKQAVQEQASSSATSTAAAAPAPAHGPNGDPGLPIPDHYETDRLVLMVQDPHNVFAYWEISNGMLQHLRQQHGRLSAALLLVHCGGDTEQRIVDLAANNYYLSLPPDQDCYVELAVRDEEGQVHVFLRSNSVRTPAHRVSDRTEVEWMDVDDRFATLLEMADIGGGMSSADLVRRLETVKWDVPSLPSSDTLLSSFNISSAALSSRSWLQST
ncbi:MAG: DUF4912 domain-containing protein [Planctomycetota bacterium]